MEYSHFLNIVLENTKTIVDLVTTAITQGQSWYKRHANETFALSVHSL